MNALVIRENLVKASETNRKCSVVHGVVPRKKHIYIF